MTMMVKAHIDTHVHNEGLKGIGYQVESIDNNAVPA